MIQVQYPAPVDQSMWGLNEESIVLLIVIAKEVQCNMKLASEAPKELVGSGAVVDVKGLMLPNVNRDGVVGHGDFHLASYRVHHGSNRWELVPEFCPCLSQGILDVDGAGILPTVCKRNAAADHPVHWFALGRREGQVERLHGAEPATPDAIPLGPWEGSSHCGGLCGFDRRWSDGLGRVE